MQCVNFPHSSTSHVNPDLSSQNSLETWPEAATNLGKSALELRWEGLYTMIRRVVGVGGDLFLGSSYPDPPGLHATSPLGKSAQFGLRSLGLENSRSVSEKTK